MVSFKVNIPENKLAPFLEFLESIEATYDVKELQEYSISKEQLLILEERSKSEKKYFLPARALLTELKKKHDLWSS